MQCEEEQRKITGYLIGVCASLNHHCMAYRSGKNSSSRREKIFKNKIAIARVCVCVCVRWWKSFKLMEFRRVLCARHSGKEKRKQLVGRQ